MKELKRLVDQLDFDSKCLQTSFVKHSNHSFSGIFNNYGDKPMGLAMYDVLKVMVFMSNHSWKLDKDEWKDWIDDAFEELEEEINKNCL